MANQSRRMWLHDENDTVNILPYTSLDNIKMRSDNLSQDFETDYNNTKNTIVNNKNNTDIAISNLDNRVSTLENQLSQGSIDLATPTANGLMSKEDKVKLNNIEAGANNYTLPIASLSQLGGIKVDGSTTTIDNNGVLHAVSNGVGSFDALSDVDLDSPLDGQIIQYDYENEKWINADLPNGSEVNSILDLTDVLITSVENNQILAYNSTLNKWINKNNNDSNEFEYITQAQIDSLFNVTIPLVSFSTGTDSEIAAMINGYYNGILSLQEIQTVWSIGDTRDIDISAITATGDGWSVGESHRAQTVTLQILDFEHDDLTIPINSKTKALITVDLKNCLRSAGLADLGDVNNNTEVGYMNATRTYPDGWEGSARYAWCNTGFYNSLPLYIKELIKQVNKTTFKGHVGDTITTTDDMFNTLPNKIFLLSEMEVMNTHNFSEITDNITEGYQYTLYETSTNRAKLPGYSESWPTCYWWGRSPRKYHYMFFRASTSQDCNYVDEINGIAPAFCM